MRQPEERRVAVLVERVLDRVGPDGGIRERFLGTQNLADLRQRAGVLQVDFGDASDDAVSGVTEAAERRGDGQDDGQSEDWPENGGAHGGIARKA